MSVEKIPRIKFCGMTQEDDIQYAAALGVDAVGLIFYSESPRYVSVSKAKELLRHVPPFMTVVAVLVNPTLSLVDEIIKELPVTCLQFHGEESPAFCSQFNTTFIKALPVKDRLSIEKAMTDYSLAAGYLFDTPSISARGGTGQSFDWGLIPTDLDKPYILAGGLTPHNIEQALKCCSPYAVDVCSGIEASPGIKDHRKMKTFVEVLRGTHNE